MSTSSVTVSVAELVSFIKSKVQTNLVESNNRGEFRAGESLALGDLEFNKLLRVIDLSISEGFSLGMNNVESALRDYTKEVQKTSQYKNDIVIPLVTKEVRKARK